MFKHILIALDGSLASYQALKKATGLAQLTGADLTILSVIEKLPAYAASVGEVQEYKEETEAHFSRIQNSAVADAGSSSIPIQAVIRAGQAAHVITQYAEENSIDLIVLGANDRGGLGGTADKVTENAVCSVLIARVGLSLIRVKDIMTKDVVTVEPATSLSQVFEVLISQRLKAVPVLLGQQVLGIITGGDMMVRAGMELRLSLQRLLPSPVLKEQMKRLTELGKTAEDVMTSPVITIGEEEGVSRAARIMSEKNIKRLPVVDKSGGLAGIVSRLDILAIFASVSPSPEIALEPSKINLRVAEDIMFRDVPTVKPDAQLEEVINKITATQLRRVVVIDDLRRVLGVIVDADLLAKVGSSSPASILRKLISRLSYVHEMVQSTVRAGEIMSRDVYTVSKETPLSEVVQLMLDKQIKRLVVVDDQRQLMGMVDRESVLRLIAYDGLAA